LKQNRSDAATLGKPSSPAAVLPMPKSAAMTDSFLLQHLPLHSAGRNPDAIALTSPAGSCSYGQFAVAIEGFATALVALGIERGERIGVYLDKSTEMVTACFGAALAGMIFVPINPVLKAEQVAHIMRDCNVRLLVTSAARLESLGQQIDACPDVRHCVIVGDRAPVSSRVATHSWSEIAGRSLARLHRVIDTDVVSILYTSGSTGRPKGVVLSHRNMVAGAKSVASYLENRAEDSLVAALPLSFDAGFSQLTTAFHVGARVALLNYLLPRDVLDTIVRERITGLTAVPPLYIQLAQLEWPASVAEHLRYFANTGGRMPLETLSRLRSRLPKVKPYLMYGLTEAFRSTYLPPEEVDRRPESIGKAIPNAEILVLREDGSPCAADEPGELVHRGALVGLGYWNDSEKTAERYRPLPRRSSGVVLTEMAVFSGDTVRADAEGFLYFVGRRDEMMKTSGYRVSPTEVEEVVYGTRLVAECAAFGVPHPVLGQAIIVAFTSSDGSDVDIAALTALCRDRMPAFMVPARFEQVDAPLPRNPNGKIDRRRLATEFNGVFDASAGTSI
jgi:acyl-CoA ligase (AMP-forming) (exosortase A-associated)